MLQNDQLNQDMIKAMDQHNRQCEELNIKLGISLSLLSDTFRVHFLIAHFLETVQEKLEGEKREIVRDAQIKQHELQVQ